jgi:hypothetical protein
VSNAEQKNYQEITRLEGLLRDRGIEQIVVCGLATDYCINATALDARERAQTATKESVNKKATARADATKALADADAALHDARAKLKAAEAAHGPARTLTMGRKAIDTEESAVQEARTAFDKGDYLGSIETARGVSAHLRPAAHDLEAAAVTSARRRH